METGATFKFYCQKLVEVASVERAGLIDGIESAMAYGIFLLFPSSITLPFSVFSALVPITIIQRLFWAQRVSL